MIAVGSFAQASTLRIPPAPNPLTTAGISVRNLMDKAGLGRFDPVVVLVRPRPGSAVSCPRGMTELRRGDAENAFRDLYSNSQQGQQGGGSSQQVPDSSRLFNTAGVCYDSSLSDNEFVKWLSALAVGILGQFTGDQLAQFVGGNKNELRLGELLDGLCVAWGNDPDLVKAVSESTDGINYLGETLCNMSRVYEGFLEVLRITYIYGDRALDRYYRGVVQGLLGSLLNPAINWAKISITNAYNSLPIAKPIYLATRRAKEIADRVIGEISDFIITSAFSRSSPYIDSTVAWLLAAGQEALESVSPQAGTLGFLPRSEGGTTPTSGTGLAALPPDKLSLIMASSSPRVLGQLQAIGERQAMLSAEKENYLIMVDEEAKKRAKGAMSEADSVGPRGDPLAAQELVKQAKQQTNERELLISLIEISYVMAQESLRNQARLEEIVASLVQESAKTNAILSREATKELDAQIKALEELKQQVLQAVLDYSSEVASAVNVMDNTIYLIGSLGVERAGLILTEEQFQRLTQPGGEPIPAP